jgi:cell wall assembly regulator SMI1
MIAMPRFLWKTTLTVLLACEAMARPPSACASSREAHHQESRMSHQIGNSEMLRASALIETWLRATSRYGLSRLLVPANDADFAFLESTTGLAIPEPLRGVLAVHDGQAAPSLFGDSFDFLSARQIAEHWRMHAAVLEHLPPAALAGEFDPDVMVQCDQGVKPLVANRKWLPFADSNGDVTRYIDFDPAPGGQVGQVIEVDPEGTVWRTLAGSFDQYMADRLRRLEAGEGPSD